MGPSLREISLRVRISTNSRSCARSERRLRFGGAETRPRGTQEYAELKGELLGNTTKLGAFISLYLGLTQHDAMALVRQASLPVWALALRVTQSPACAPRPLTIIVPLCSARSSEQAGAWRTLPFSAGTLTTWCETTPPRLFRHCEPATARRSSKVACLIAPRLRRIRCDPFCSALAYRPRRTSRRCPR